MFHSNLRSFVMSAKHVGALVQIDAVQQNKMYGKKILCRALVLLIENLYWTISILNEDFGTKC